MANKNWMTFSCFEWNLFFIHFCFEHSVYAISSSWKHKISCNNKRLMHLYIDIELVLIHYINYTIQFRNFLWKIVMWWRFTTEIVTSDITLHRHGMLSHTETDDTKNEYQLMNCSTSNYLIGPHHYRIMLIGPKYFLSNKFIVRRISHSHASAKHQLSIFHWTLSIHNKQSPCV